MCNGWTVVCKCCKWGIQQTVAIEISFHHSANKMWYKTSKRDNIIWNELCITYIYMCVVEDRMKIYRHKIKTIMLILYTIM